MSSTQPRYPTRVRKQSKLMQASEEQNPRKINKDKKSLPHAVAQTLGVVFIAQAIFQDPPDRNPSADKEEDTVVFATWVDIPSAEEDEEELDKFADSFFAVETYIDEPIGEAEIGESHTQYHSLQENVDGPMVDVEGGSRKRHRQGDY